MSTRLRRIIYAREGEWVKIKTPKLFVRCGYPLSETVLMETRSEEVIALMKAAWSGLLAENNIQIEKKKEEQKEENEFQFEVVKIAVDLGYIAWPPRVQRLLQSAACSYIMHKESWGGHNREIYQKELPWLQGQIVQVLSKRYIRTGVYSPGHSGGYYSDDYEPAGLDSQQVHCLYKFDFSETSNIIGIGANFIPMDEKLILADNCLRETGV